MAKGPDPGPSQQRVKSIGKKRKDSSLVDPFEGLTASLTMNKLAFLVNQVSTHVDKMEDLMLSKMEEDNRALEDKEKALKERDQTIKELKASFEWERSVWMNKQEAMQKKHNEDVSQIQNSAALVVFEARLSMARQAAAEGFKSLNWDIKTWEETVIGLGGVVTDSLIEAKADEQQEDVMVGEGADKMMTGDADTGVEKDAEGL